MLEKSFPFQLALVEISHEPAETPKHCARDYQNTKNNRENRDQGGSECGAQTSHQG
jgi:hypothetical protein